MHFPILSIKILAFFYDLSFSWNNHEATLIEIGAEYEINLEQFLSLGNTNGLSHAMRGELGS